MTKKYVPWLLDRRSQDKLHNIVVQNKSSWFQKKAAQLLTEVTFWFKKLF